MSIKICIIGAGSAVFSLKLLRDICLNEGLRGSKICFMDVDEERLDIAYSLARRYAEELGRKDLAFEKTLNRRKALQDADFVINTALSGGHKASEQERQLEEKYGYYRGMMCFSGTGYYTIGTYFRQLKLMLEIARDMEDICPDAWLIQASNPVFDGCTLMTRETKIKVIGLCHGHYGVYRIAEVLCLDPKKIEFQAVGINHCIWLTDFLYKGKDAYPLIDEWIEKRAKKYWEEWKGEPTDVQMSPASVFLYRMFGLFPVGDTPRFAGAWWFHTDLKTKKRWFNRYGGFDSEIGWNYYLKRLGERFDEMKRLRESSKPITDKLPPKFSGEQHIPIIDAIVNNHKDIFQVNVPNRGCIEGIEDDVVVEVPAIIDGNGVHPLHVKSLPKFLTRHIIKTHVIPMELGLQSFIERDRKILLYIILSDHRTKSLEQAQELIEKELALPFNKDLREWFRKETFEEYPYII